MTGAAWDPSHPKPPGCSVPRCDTRCDTHTAQNCSCSCLAWENLHPGLHSAGLKKTQTKTQTKPFISTHTLVCSHQLKAHPSKIYFCMKSGEGAACLINQSSSRSNSIHTWALPVATWSSGGHIKARAEEPGLLHGLCRDPGLHKHPGTTGDNLFYPSQVPQEATGSNTRKS